MNDRIWPMPVLGAATALLVGAAAPAKAATISLVCGFETVIIDTDAKTVEVVSSSPDSKTKENSRRTYRDQYKYRSDSTDVTQFVTVTADAITYGNDTRTFFGPNIVYKIDRYTGIYSASILQSPVVCTLKPLIPLF